MCVHVQGPPPLDAPLRVRLVFSMYAHMAHTSMLSLDASQFAVGSSITRSQISVSRLRVTAQSLETWDLYGPRVILLLCDRLSSEEVLSGS